MTPYRGGFVILARDLLEHPLWLTLSDSHRVVLITTLLLANWRDVTWWCKAERKELTVKRGSFVASIERIAAAARVTKSTCVRALRGLADRGFIDTQSTRHYTLITIRNYVARQDLLRYSDTRAGTRAVHERYTSGTRAVLTEEEKKRRREEEEKRDAASAVRASRSPRAAAPPPEFPETHWARPIASGWMAELGLPPAEQERLTPLWLQALDKLHRLDKRPQADIARLVSWIARDRQQGTWTGWAENCQTPLKLRRRNRDGRLYYDVIWGHMLAAEGRGGGNGQPSQVSQRERDTIARIIREARAREAQG